MITTSTGWGRMVGWTAMVASLALLSAAVAYQFWGVIQDTALALRYRFGLDYGEGIVWQQVLLLFGPRMYSPSPELPFIVFHYPPLYHFVVRALLPLGLDPLFAGRLVSIAASAATALSVGALILVGVRARLDARHVGLAAVMALLLMCLPAIRTWGSYMRVDLLAQALGMMGTLVFVMRRSSMGGTIVGLLFCVAAVFTKQTQLPAGVAVCLVALACAPRRAVIAALVAGAVGLLSAATLEVTTGGFFKNIVSYNINPFTFGKAADNLWKEREAAPFVVLMLLGFARTAWRFKDRSAWSKLRAGERQSLLELVICLHFVLACLSTVEILKDGSSNNYFIDLLASGFVLVGLLLCEMAAKPLLLTPAALVLALATLNLRHTYNNPQRLARNAIVDQRLVEQIAAADRPVSSDDMVLVLRSGKSLVFEPAIVRVLVAGGKWDPAPLLSMIGDHGFAFMLTYSDANESGPVITRAIDEAYPRLEEVRPGLIAHYPP